MIMLLIRKKTKSKKNTVDDNAIISLYMNEVLENNEAPKNAYIFCKNHNIEESDFYAFFGSLDAVKQDIWVKFFEMADDNKRLDRAVS